MSRQEPTAAKFESSGVRGPVGEPPRPTSNRAPDTSAAQTHAPFVERAKNGGEQKVYRFENGYGASVVRGPYTYGGDAGLWELGVLLVMGDDEPSWPLTYGTPITDDYVIGYLSWDEVEVRLAQIAALPKAGS